MDEPVIAISERSTPIKRKKPVFGMLSVVAVAMIVLLYILAVIIGFPSKGELAPEQGYHAGLAVASLVSAIFLATIGSSIISAIGLIFGITGIVQKNRSKVLAIIGTTINGLLLASFLIVLIAIRLSRN
jgi:hypothetical protein